MPVTVASSASTFTPNPAPLRVGIIVGEASGDTLGAGLIQAIRQRYPNAQFEGVAGPKMIAAGCHALYSSEELAVFGLFEVVKHLPRLFSLRHALYCHFRDNPPDLFIGIDAPDFNLGLEAKLRYSGIRTVHYVSPSIWAWRQKRVFKVAEATDLVLTLFPFEVEFYHRYGVPAVCVGHPLADDIADHTDQQQCRKQLGLAPQKTTVAILPGSRGSELKYLGTTFIFTALWLLKKRAQLQFVAPMANPRIRTLFEQHLAELAPELPITLLDGQAREAMGAADVVLLASGTAALEGMLVKRPMVMSYRVARLTYWILSRVVKITQYSLPNLLSGKTLIPELVQDDAVPEKLGPAVLTALDDQPYAQTLVTEFQALHQQLRLGGSQRAADAVLNLLND